MEREKLYTEDVKDVREYQGGTIDMRKSKILPISVPITEGDTLGKAAKKIVATADSPDAYNGKWDKMEPRASHTKRRNMATIMENGAAYCNGMQKQCTFASFVPGGDFCTDESEHSEHSVLCMNKDAIEDAKNDK